MTAPHNLKEKLCWFLILNLGLILTALGISIFKTPNHFAIGGTSGLAILLAGLFPHLDVSGAMAIINLALVVLGFAFLGRGFAGATVYASAALSAYVALTERLFPPRFSPHRRHPARAGLGGHPAGGRLGAGL